MLEHELRDDEEVEPKRAKVEKLVVVQVTVLAKLFTVQPVSSFQFTPSYLCILRVCWEIVGGMSASVYVIVIVIGLLKVVTEVPTPLSALRSYVYVLMPL